MPGQSVFDMGFNRVYAALVAKAEKNGRTKSEVDECIRWLTDYVNMDILDGLTYGQFLSLAPVWNPRAELIIVINTNVIQKDYSAYPDT
ncbi:MAG: DUF2200 family protein [Clostridia bacterium]|nr:DUF2200 family protein [Clostridia bacterium]